MRQWGQVWTRRLRAIFRSRRMEEELEAEMADHLASEVEELVRRGMPRAEAEWHARATFGGRLRIEEECRDARGVRWWEDTRQDAAFAWRMLRKQPTFTLLALGTMALGIGTTAAVFSVVDTIWIRPLPYPEPERLLSVEGIGMRGPFMVARESSQLADYAAHQGVRSFTLISRAGTLPDRVKGSEVSGNFFSVLGRAPWLGRTFAAGDDQPGKPRQVVLSYDFWQERFGGRSDVIGRKLQLNELPFEIVGVMPAGFHFPAAESQLWTTMRLDPRVAGEYWGAGGTAIFARMKRGVTLPALRSELASTVVRIRRMFPWPMPDLWGSELRIVELREALIGDTRLRGWMLLTAVTAVLLIAIVNVANLLLGQMAARTREFAMRTSLGASPRRLVRQLLTECLLLALAGGASGLALAYGLVAALRQLLPAATPRLAEVTVDGRVLAFTAIVSVASGVLFGLWPALAPARPMAARGTRRVAGGLVTAEAALASLLLVGAVLLLRSLWAILQVDPGIRVESVVAAEFTPSRAVVASAEKAEVQWKEVQARLASYPGVRAVAAMDVLPLTPEVRAFAAAIEDHPLPERAPQYVLWSTAVTPQHLDVLGVKLLEGRGFNDGDRVGAEPVVLVDRSTAQRYWPGRSALGRRLKPVYDSAWRTIVGVVEDVRTYGIHGPPDWVQGEVYVPMSQAQAHRMPVSLVLRLEGSPAPIEKALPGLVHEVCRTCAVSQVQEMRQVVARAVSEPRSTALLIAGFAALALLLAAAGIYGVVNHSVVRRTRELGIRLALGSSRGRIAGEVLRSSLTNVALGIAVGLSAAWVLTRLMTKLLYGVAPHDAGSFVAGPLLLLAVALAASAAPAWRATRVDPAQSLREG